MNTTIKSFNIKPIWVISFIGLFLVAVYFIMSVSYSNTDKVLRNALVAKESAREAIFDETWKTIKQVAQVSQKYADDFKEVYPLLMTGRYGEDKQALMKWITESNPELKTDLYEKVASVVEVKRAEFTSIQRALIDLKREHDNLLDLFPGSYFLAGKEKVKITIISSEKTKGVITSGEDNDVDLFN